MARQTPIQAILLDMSLPSLHGWETLHLLRDDLRTAAIPVVVLSAFGALNDPEVEKAADAWLEQPLETESMLAALSRVLQVERQPSRVLLVEDDADLAKVILATFERAGIQVHHASTQRKAMELCVSSRPDLLILDIALARRRWLWTGRLAAPATGDEATSVGGLFRPGLERGRTQ